jgi:hypothetical protein
LPAIFPRLPPNYAGDDPFRIVPFVFIKAENPHSRTGTPSGMRWIHEMKHDGTASNASTIDRERAKDGEYRRAQMLECPK